MALTRRDQSLLNRMLPVGIGDLTRGKLAELVWLRQKDIILSTHLAAEGFIQEPLAGTFSKTKLKELFAPIYRASDLNQYYAETTAYRVIDALINQKDWYIRQLKGRLANCGERIPAKILRKGDTRRYFYVPEAFQDVISEAELKDLAAYCSEDRKGEAINLFRKVIVQGKTSKLSAAQMAVIREIYRQVQAMFHCPRYGEDERYVSQFILDWRNITV